MKIYLTCALLACSLCAFTQIPGDVIAKKCDSIFNTYKDGPGVAVLIVQDGKIAFEKGYGIANLEYNIPITPTTVFDIASVSKQFTGYAISTLIQRARYRPKMIFIDTCRICLISAKGSRYATWYIIPAACATGRKGCMLRAGVGRMASVGTILCAW